MEPQDKLSGSPRAACHPNRDTHYQQCSLLGGLAADIDLTQKTCLKLRPSFDRNLT